MEHELSKILHQPIRTKIMAYLITNRSCDFTKLKEVLNLSDGHMTTHMRELLAHKYVVMEKKFVDQKPKTTYILTSEGREAFAKYVQTLRSIIEDESLSI